MMENSPDVLPMFKNVMLKQTERNFFIEQHEQIACFSNSLVNLF